MDSEMTIRLCKDCRHHKRTWLGYNVCLVAPPGVRYVLDVVTGERKLKGGKSCYEQRLWFFKGYCGPRGAKWQPR